MVLSRLRPETGAALLAALAAEQRAKVLTSLVFPRNVGLELIRGMKTELENRLYGVVGGAAEAAPFLKGLPYKERKSLLDRICSQDPERGAELRAFFILDDDLLAMPDKDLKALAAAAGAEKLGALLPCLPDKLRAKLKEQFSGKDEAVLENAAPSVSPGPREREAGLAKFMELLEKLVARGVVARPQPKVKTPAESAGKSPWG